MENKTENENRTAAKDLTSGPLEKQILFFSLPLMASNILQVLFNMADVAVVGQFAGSVALGSVGSTTILVALYTGVLIGLSSGINILVALAMGAGDQKSVTETVHTALLISGMTGVFLLAAGVLSASGILRLLHTKPELLAGAVMYLRIYLLGLPALALYNFGNAVLSAAGDTKRPLLYLSAAGVLNVALNLFFVLVCQLSVAGVALASIISQYVSAFLILRHLFPRAMSQAAVLARTVGECREGQYPAACSGVIDLFAESYGLRRESLRINKERAVRILQLGVPAGLQNAIFYVANLFVQMGVNSFDAVMVAGNSAAANADNLVYDMMAAFYTACGSFIGQNYGAKQKKRIIKSYFISMFYAFILAFVLGVGLVVCGRQFLSLFSPDSAVIAAGMVRLKIMGFSYCVSAFMDSSIAAARSLGKSLVPTVIVIMGACVFRVVWIYTVFAHFGTPASLYLLFVCSWTVTAIVGNLYFAKVYREAVKAW